MRAAREHLSENFVLRILLMFACLSASVSSAAEAPERVHFTIDARENLHPISPFIYGVNQPLEGALLHATLRRIGGNRFSAYNWLNNASNAGSDYHY
jgi:hypothetical protein